MLFIKDVWPFLMSFQSTSVVHSFLKDSYNSRNINNADLKSYDNCYSFIYYIEHGKKYYDLAKQAPDELKPVLLFYGMVQLIKACLLTVDPNYPQTTAVLAHGVSARKRKKRDYAFLHDEVKIQKDGLLRHFSAHLFQLELPVDRFQMESLFARIPEMNPIFLTFGKQQPSLKVKHCSDGVYHLPLSLLDRLHMTERRFEEFLIENSELPIQAIEKTEQGFAIHAAIEHPLHCSPFFYHAENEFYIPAKRELFKPLQEIIVHYLLLYNLSMICRYETEWWNELFHTFSSDDLPFIRRFLQISETKTPYLLALYLKKRS